MKFTCTKDVLLKEVQLVQIGINSKTTLPILANIMMEAIETGIIFTATDLDIGITIKTDIKTATQGSITVPAKKFSDIIKELPDNESITISAKKNNMVTIECAKSSFKIMGLPKEEFPQLPNLKDNESVVLNQKQLKKMFKMTSFAISHDETRYVLNGILMVIKPGYIRAVATDGRRLAVAEQKMQLPKTLERRIILPTKAVSELEKILGDDGDVKVLFGENQICFEVGNIRLVSRLIEGDFPNYEQVIPKEAKDKIVVGRNEFLAAIKRVALFTNPDSLAVKIEISKDRMMLSKSAPYLGEAQVEIGVEYKGKDISIGFNPVYLIDLLKNLEELSIPLEISDTDKPGVIRMGSEYVYVVLPMQLG